MSLIKNLKNSDLKQRWKGLRNAVLQIGPLEQLVRDCTNNEPWAAKMSDKQEIARRTHSHEDYQVIMSTLWKRMQQEGQNFRKIQKSLSLLEFLLYQGSDRIVSEAKSNIYQLRSLRNFHYTDDNGKECGGPVRELSRKLVKLLKDEQALKEERKKQKKLAGRFQGMSREEASWGGVGSGAYSSGGGYGGGGFGSGDYNDSDDDVPRRSNTKKNRYDSDSDSDSGAQNKRKDSDEEQEEIKTRPRRDSNIRVHSTSTSAPVRAATTAPAQTKVEMPKPVSPPPAKQENILDMDDFFSQQQQQQQQQQAPQNGGGFNPRGNPQQQFNNDEWETGFDESAGNPFDEQQQQQPKNELHDAFDDNDFGEGDFVSGQEEEKGSLFNMSKGLVDLSLSDKPRGNQQQQQQQQGPRKTLNQIKSEKVGILNPGRSAAPLRPIGGGPSYPQQPQGGYPQQGGFPQGGYPPQNPNMRGPMGGYPQQGGFPPQQPGYPPQNPNMRGPMGGYPQQGGYPPQQNRMPPQATVVDDRHKCPAAVCMKVLEW
eukprot:CAMPEP_0117441692 /NCGR_PEP_ID=MMETSP0759-20121206/3764_1 /TAXON_ID=63605 /ORGANISM="Percolomonas cosmopolitus, Strain WS" /LENGTH=537 /DNA_ID=CAMNT_0005233551 /DNA_START=128 /DNA_END=1739 /DNA_ORIENTATION=+